MKKIISVLFTVITITSYSQSSLVIWGNTLFLKTGNDSISYGSPEILPLLNNLLTNVNSKQPALVSGTNLKTINGQPITGPGDIAVTATASWGSVTGNITTQSDLLSLIIDKDILAYQALGCNFKSGTVGQSLFYANTSSSLVDGQIRYIATYLQKAETITGLKVYVRTAGSYTGDNNNRIGLYSYSNGVLTLVASSANSSSLWTSAANAIQTIPFSSPYAATPGIYFMALIYNQSAQTTAPALASGVALNNIAMSSTAFGFTNSAKIYGVSSSTDLPASINMTAVSATATPTWMATY